MFFSILAEIVADIKFKLGINLDPTIKFKLWISSHELVDQWCTSGLGETLSFIFLIWFHFYLHFCVFLKFDSEGNWYNMKYNLEINLKPIMKFKFWINSRELKIFWFESGLDETMGIIFTIWLYFDVAFGDIIWI